ncbi:MAG: FGGY family carbohydrate kinase [Planctomycetota bacterium]|nr:FGGY family carbohydrate kinase [Planctomycetota bacterium]
MSFLGIDIGMTGCKAAAFSTDGRQLSLAYREYPTLRAQPGYAELDSRLVWSCVEQVIAQVASETISDPIIALGVSSMGEAMIPISADRQILGNCILCSDTRGSEYIDRLREKITPREFYDINPNILSAAYSLPKLLWIQEHDFDLYKLAYKFLLWGDLVAFMLGCEPVTSTSHANRTLLLDIRREDWSDRLLDLTGIDRGKLPRIVSGGAIAGTVSNSTACRLGLPPGVKVVVGGHDQCCNSLGAGITRPGQAVCGIGTVQCITPTYDHIPNSAAMLQHGLNIEHHVLPGLYVSFIFNQAGSLVRWFRDTFAAADRRLLAGNQDIYDVLNSELPVDPTPLLVLPHFEPTGSPHYIADSSGVIVGLKMTTSRGEILKAIMQSVAFYFVESIDALKAIGIDTSQLIATGGGAKSDAWLQIQADIFGIPILRPRTTESGLVGGAILCALAVGAFSDASSAASQFVQYVRTYDPNPTRHARYCELYARYQQIFPRLKDLLSPDAAQTTPR